MTDPDGSSATLVCVGNVTIDEAVQPDGTTVEALGGDAIFATLAARLGHGHAEWLAPIGNDLPATIAAELARADLSVDDQPHRELPTIRNRIRYDADGHRSWDMLCSDDDFDRLSIRPRDVPAWVLDAAGVLVLAMSLQSQLELLPWLRANSTATIYLDLQEDYLDGHEQQLLELIGSCDVFMPSEVEATHLSGLADPGAAARFFQERGPDTIVIKLAERGCVIAAGAQLLAVPTQVVEPVDPTGAGDAFCGAFAAEHLRTGAVLAAAEAGARAARVAVSGPGVHALLAAVAEVRA